MAVMRIESAGSTASSSYAAGWWTPRLTGPVIAAALVRLALMASLIARFGTGALLQSDTFSYLEPGRNLLLHGRFMADGVPDLVRTPGYPLFLAIVSLAGMTAAALANVILSVFSVILVWRLGRTAFGDERIALGAAWIFAFEPVSFTDSVVLISETLFLALFLLSMERLAEFLRGHRLRVLAAAGLWLAAATFVRPIAYYLPFALALGLFLVLAHIPSLPPQRQEPVAGDPGLPPQRQEPVAGDPGLRWKAPAVLLISVLPWLAAWQMRNWVETGYRGFSSITEINLYLDEAADVIANVEHRNFFDVGQELGNIGFTDNSGQFYLFPPYLARHPEQAGWSQGQRLAFMRSEALRIIRSHFGLYLHSCLVTTYKTLFDTGAGHIDALATQGAPVHISALLKNEGVERGAVRLAKVYPCLVVEKIAFAVFLLGLYWFAALGAVRCGMHNACLWLLLGTSLYFLAVTGAASAAPIAGGRFRLPVMPAVCILAAAGFRRASGSRAEDALE
jgi:hypothetical protein